MQKGGSTAQSALCRNILRKKGECHREDKAPSKSPKNAEYKVGQGAGTADSAGDIHRGGYGHTPNGKGICCQPNPNSSESHDSAGCFGGFRGGRAALSVICQFTAESKRRNYCADDRYGAYQSTAGGAVRKDIADIAGDKANNAAA